MPEGPEVETVRRTLKHFILDAKITSVDVFYDKIIEDDTALFKGVLKDQHIRDIDRFGKYLIFILDDYAFISHLRMEGKFNIKPQGSPLDKHDHVVFYLNDGRELRYNDTRKFGRMKLCDKLHYLSYPPFNKLGVDPHDAHVEDVYDKLHKSALPIKTLLLDQHIFVGIGNIYANEICFRMGMDPRTRGKCLSKKRVAQLISIGDEVLSEAIRQGGTTIHSFDANGIHGLFQVQLDVHMQKTCKKCHGEIKKIMLGGRGTYYCPVCQKRRY
jgi:formamidopyrimidine-DNA glycosylase